MPITMIEYLFSLLTPKDHVSRSKGDCYYVNKDYLLRAHMTAHTSELIRSGLNAFLTLGDVYRRDEIDSKHYPVFHQCDGARLFNKYDLFTQEAIDSTSVDIFETNSSLAKRTGQKQAEHTLNASKLVEDDLKNTLTNLVQFIFGSCKLIKSSVIFEPKRI